MDNTARTSASKLTYDPKSSTYERIFSPRNHSSPTVNNCGSWKSRMFAKIKECKDAIRNVMKLRDSTVLTIPGIIIFSELAKNSEEEELLVDSSLNTQETVRSNASTGPLNSSICQNSSFHYSTLDPMSSFLENKRPVAEEFAEEDATRSATKKKISAEPFLLYSEDTAEFIWSDDT